MSLEVPSSWDRLPGLFHFLSVGPPLAILCACLPQLSFPQWFPFWYVIKASLPTGIGSLGCHAITVYASYSALREEQRFSSEASLLAAAVAVGLLMGVTFRNVVSAFRWRIFGEGTPSTAKSAAATLPPPRSPSVLVPLPAVGKRAGGTGEFPVKVLLPTAKFSQGMVYNERKTLQAFIDLEDASQSGMATLVRIIATEGGGGGVKGYFAARREGEALRIFAERALPDPVRPW